MNTRSAVALHISLGACLPVFAWLALNPIGIEAQATHPPYLREMPAVERVKAEIKGTDPMDTAARQAGAFFQFRQIIYDLALNQRRDRNEVTPDEKRLAEAYYAAAYYASQPVEKSLSEQDKPKWVKLRGRYEGNPKFREELFTQFFSASFRTAYFKAIGDMDARVQARQDAEQEAFKEAQAAQAAAGQTGYDDPGTVAARRCIEAGRDPLKCVAEAMGGGLNQMLGVAGVTVKKEQPAGLRMNGEYRGQGSFSMVFTHAMNEYSAVATCNGVSQGGAFNVEMKENQLLIRIQKGATPFVLSFRSDGNLVGSGTIQVTGPVAVGTRHGTRTYSDGSTAPISETVYESRTETCILGLLSPTSAEFAAGAQEVGIGRPLNAIIGTSGSLPTGLRMHGRYAGQAGFDVEFHPESAVLMCQGAEVAHPYTVEKQDQRVVVNIRDGAKPIVLELGPNGKLASSGLIQVKGRKVAGMSNTNEPVFAPVTGTCTLGILSPTQANTENAAAAGAAAARAAYNPSEAARPNTASTPSTATSAAGNAVLSVTGFVTQPGVPNPLGGQSLFLLKESFETVLTNGGFRPAAGIPPIQGWLAACTNGQPVCGQALAGIETHDAGYLKADVNGQAQFPALPSGTYYLFAMTRYNNQPMVWNLQVDLRPGQNSVMLHQQNAAH